MSEDKTRDISQRYDTKPTLEVILERINAVGEETRAGFAALEKRLEDFDVRVCAKNGSITPMRMLGDPAGRARLLNGAPEILTPKTPPNSTAYTTSCDRTRFAVILKNRHLRLQLGD